MQMLTSLLFLLVLSSERGAERLDRQDRPGEHPVVNEPEPALQMLFVESPASTSGSPLKLSSDGDNESTSSSIMEDAKRPVDVTTVSVNMGNIGGGLTSSTFRLKTVEGKVDGTTLSESTSKTLDVSTINDNGEKTSVVQSLSSKVDVFPTTGKGDLLINGSTINAVGMTTSQGQQSAAVMKDVLSSTTEVNGSSGVRGVANHSLNTATLGREGLVSVMQETAALTSQVKVPEDGTEPNVTATTCRSVGMATGMLNKDTTSLNVTNLNSTQAYQRQPHEGSVNNKNLLERCQRQIEDLRYELRRCQAQKGGPMQTRV